MIRLVLRIVGILLIPLAIVQAYFAMWFRLDSMSELRMIEQVDLALGFAFATIFVLLFAPDRFEGSRAWRLTLAIAVIIWVCVTGSMIWSHREMALSSMARCSRRRG